MNPSDTPAPKSRFLPGRRLALLAGVAGLGAAVLFTAPGFLPQASLPGIAHAQNLTEQARKLPQPVGFADIVEKVKPAVISVRVRIENARTTSNSENPFPQGSPMDRFFRRFGQPENSTPDDRARARRPQLHDRPGLGLLHLRRRLRGDQQPRRRQGRERSGHDRRRQDLHRQGDRHRSAHRRGPDQGRWPQRLPVRRLHRAAAAHRRLGARGRQSVRARRHRDRRHRVGARPRYRRRPL